jgi:hypothetical protein
MSLGPASDPTLPAAVNGDPAAPNSAQLAGRQITVSVFSSDEPIGKRRGLAADGSLRKVTSAPRLQSVRQVGFDTIEAFARYALDAPATEALTFGVCSLQEARVAVGDGDKREAVVARTKEYFAFAEGPGVLLLDCDPLPGETPLSPIEIVDLVRAAVPALRSVALSAKPSSSAHLHAPDGTELVGAAGVHIFVPVHAAQRIPALGAIIAERLWLAGHGRIKITGNGARHFATPIDTSVWSPERLVFVRAACEDGVDQRLGEISYFPGDCDDLVGESWLADLAPLTEEEQVGVAEVKRQAYVDAEPAARAAREKWVEQQLDKRVALAEERGEEIDREAVKASLHCDEHVLPGDLVLHPLGRGPITAREMFEEGAQWDGVRLADAFEPDYGDPRIALVVFSCDEPHIFSHAHGGQRYLFRSDVERDAEIAAEFDDLGPPARRKFEGAPAGEFIKGKPPAWLVKGLLPEAALGVVYGASGSGKTFFVLDLVAKVACGEPWRGKRTQQRKVAYICAEGVAGFRNRVQAYTRQHDADFGERLVVISQPPNLLDAGDAKELVAEIARGGAQVVVVDTFAQVTPGADENSAVDMGKALRVCRNIHDASGALVLLVLHTGKDPARGARGWSGTRAAADVEIEVTKGANDHSATITKMKDGEDGRAFGFKLIPIWLGDDEDGDEITSCVVTPCDFSEAPPPRRFGAKQRAVLDALYDLTPISGDAVAIEDVLTRAVEALPVDLEKRDRRREHARRALSELIAQAVIAEANGEVRAFDTTGGSKKEENK